MITRARVGVSKSKTYRCLTINQTPKLPSFVLKALQNINWKNTTHEEFDALIKNKTWTCMPYTLELKVIDCKWVFKIKYNLNRTVSLLKARLSSNRIHQTSEIDFSETFSLVVKPQTFMTVLSIVVSKG